MPYIEKKWKTWFLFRMLIDRIFCLRQLFFFSFFVEFCLLFLHIPCAISCFARYCLLCKKRSMHQGREGKYASTLQTAHRFDPIAREMKWTRRKNREDVEWGRWGDRALIWGKGTGGVGVRKRDGRCEDGRRSVFAKTRWVWNLQGENE